MDLSNRSEDLPPKAARLVSGVLEHVQELDDEIDSASDHWRVQRMPVVDRAILRLGLYEFRYETDTPAAVVVAEAVRLAKTFSTERSGAFVNGVLATLAGRRTRLGQPAAAVGGWRFEAGGGMAERLTGIAGRARPCSVGQPLHDAGWSGVVFGEESAPVGGTVGVDLESHVVDDDVMVIPQCSLTRRADWYMWRVKEHTNTSDEVVGVVVAAVGTLVDVVGLEPVTAATSFDGALPLVPPQHQAADCRVGWLLPDRSRRRGVIRR